MNGARRTWLWTGMFLLLIPGLGCARASPALGDEGTNAMTAEVAADLTVARRGRIVFSHHSVGANILSGIEQLDSAAGGPRMRFASLEEAGGLEGPLLAHGRGGRNGDPKSKIDFFAALVRNGRRLRPDLAFMKLCYVDFNPRTDVDDLFSYYRRTLQALKAEHPEIQFAHVTVPLFRRPSDVKSSLRRILGREVWEDAANVKRGEYNRRLIETFASDPVFDLARAEATGPDGEATSFEYERGRYPSMHARYTDDGGHLNPLGQRVVGVAAIRFLADALRHRRDVR